MGAALLHIEPGSLETQDGSEIAKKCPSDALQKQRGLLTVPHVLGQDSGGHHDGGIVFISSVYCYPGNSIPRSPDSNTPVITHMASQICFLHPQPTPKYFPQVCQFYERWL